MKKMIALVCLGVAFTVSVPAVAAGEKMKGCSKEATGMKGDERKMFMKKCLSKDYVLKSDMAADATAPDVSAPATPAALPRPTPPANGEAPAAEPPPPTPTAPGRTPPALHGRRSAPPEGRRPRRAPPRAASRARRAGTPCPSQGRGPRSRPWRDPKKVDENGSPIYLRVARSDDLKIDLGSARPRRLLAARGPARRGLAGGAGQSQRRPLRARSPTSGGHRGHRAPRLALIARRCPTRSTGAR